MKAKCRLRNYVVNKNDWMIGFIPAPYIAYEKTGVRMIRIGLSFLWLQLEIVFYEFFKNK